MTVPSTYFLKAKVLSSKSIEDRQVSLGRCKLKFPEKKKGKSSKIIVSQKFFAHICIPFGKERDKLKCPDGGIGRRVGLKHQ